MSHRAYQKPHDVHEVIDIPDENGGSFSMQKDDSDPFKRSGSLGILKIECGMQEVVPNDVGTEMENIIVSIIIPAYNEEAIIEDCLNSIIEVDCPKTQYEIIVVDDGSTDRTYEIASSYQAEYDNIVVLSKTNGGKASAQNYGLKVARGKYILVTDADAIVNKDWVSRIVKHLENYDIVVGACYAKDPITWLEKIQNAHYLIKFKYGGIKGIPSTGVNNAFRKDILNIIGGFDETKTSITGDFISRGRDKGLKIHYDPEIYVYTKCTNNLHGFLRQKLRWREAGTSSFRSLMWWRDTDRSHLLSFGYTYGLSIFLFASLLLSLCYKEICYIVFAAIATYLLSFSIYSVPFYRMLKNQKDRHFTIYFLMYELVELGIRLLLVPYIVYRILVPRTKPTFEAHRE